MNNGQKTALAIALIAALIAGGLFATRASKPPAPPPAMAETNPQTAVLALMALPELKTWSQQIELSSKGELHGAVIGGDAPPKTVNGKTYYAFSFVENGPERARRLQSFYVTADGKDILVEDDTSGNTLTLDAWRAAKR